MFDFHIHTNNSHDSRQTTDEVCLAAKSKGLRGIAITDHVDMGVCFTPGTYENMARCIDEVKAARQKYDIEIYQGIELAEYNLDPEGAKKILELCNYDVILGSVHYVSYDNLSMAYSCIDFSSYTEEWIHGFMKSYFDCVLNMAENVDIDVLTHITCPVRYISGKYGCRLDISDYNSQIRKILETIIKNNIALEINTSGLGSGLNDFMPGENIIKLYRELGGRLVTIGSDAHIPDRIGCGITDAKELLKSLDFKSYHYYKNRSPYEVKL